MITTIRVEKFNNGKTSTIMSFTYKAQTDTGLDDLLVKMLIEITKKEGYKAVFKEEIDNFFESNRK